MPTPVFIICSRGSSEDRHTNLLSLFNIVETVELRQADPNAPPPIEGQVAKVGGSEITVYAAWMREDGDGELEFEHEFKIVAPVKVPELPTTTFRYDGEVRLHRFRLTLVGFPVPPASSLYYFESRIRVAGSDGDWRVLTVSGIRHCSSQSASDCQRSA